jgi:hypothetical protein
MIDFIDDELYALEKGNEKVQLEMGRSQGSTAHSES